jgi:diguanylate cyclase (GGDEF)-like protein
MANLPLTQEELQARVSELEADIERLSTTDSLTGLLTRAAFLAEANQRIYLPTNPGSHRPGTLIEVLVRDIPRITGTLGRHVGDYVISALTSRLNLMSLPDNVKGRLSQDQFAILFPNITDPLMAMTTAKEILEVLQEPVDWLDRSLVMDVAAGVALAADCDSEGEGDAASLLHNADLAVKIAVQRGGANYAFYNPALAKSAKRRMDVLNALQQGLENGYIEMYFQPVFEAKATKLVGFEALMRMKTPELGNVSPVEFIPIAEESGLIAKLGAWALFDACRIASNWPSHLTVAVNLSPEQFYAGTVTTDVHHALQLSSLPANQLELEVTESSVLKDSESVQIQFLALQELGCGIALDDFGTGYSSLSYLWKFPFSKLKIDRAFIAAMDSTPVAKGILETILSVAKHVGLKVTAEGIETKEQKDVLTGLGAHFLQGFYFGQPMSESELPGFLLSQIDIPRNSGSDIIDLRLAANRLR